LISGTRTPLDLLNGIWLIVSSRYAKNIRILVLKNSKEYDLKDMSFASFDKLAEKIRTNPEVAKAYQFNHDSGSHDQSFLTESKNERLKSN